MLSQADHYSTFDAIHTQTCKRSLATHCHISGVPIVVADGVQHNIQLQTVAQQWHYAPSLERWI